MKPIIFVDESSSVDPYILCCNDCLAWTRYNPMRPEPIEIVHNRNCPPPRRDDNNRWQRNYRTRTATTRF